MLKIPETYIKSMRSSYMPVVYKSGIYILFGTVGGHLVHPAICPIHCEILFNTKLLNNEVLKTSLLLLELGILQSRLELIIYIGCFIFE